MLGSLLVVAGPSPLPAGAEPAVAAPTTGVRLINLLAGDGRRGYGGDGGPASQASLNEPWGIAVDSGGNTYVADTENHRVRKVAPDGTIVTLAGNGLGGYAGDGGEPVEAMIDSPRGLAVAADGTLYIADYGNDRVRKVADGKITTVAGGGDIEAASGISALDARLNRPRGVVVDGAGNLYISEHFGHRVRRVDSEGLITTVAGLEEVPTSGLSQTYGDGGPATAALLDHPDGLAMDAGGNLYIADARHGRVRKVVPGADGVVDGGHDETITTFAGSDDGCPTFTGEDGPAAEATMCYPSGVAVDGGGSVYIAETNGRVLVVGPSGRINTFAGTGASGYSGDGGPATSAAVRTMGVAVDPVGNVFLADTGNHRARVVGALSVRVLGSPDPVPAGGELTYTVGVDNFTAAPSTSTQVTDTLPRDVSFRSVTPSQGSCRHASGTVACQLGVLPAHSHATVTIKVGTPNKAATLANTVRLVADHPDTVSVDDTSTALTQVAPPTLGLTMTDAPDPVAAGATLTYSLAVTNHQPHLATKVTLTDGLPAQVSFARATPSQGNCTYAGATVTCGLGSLAYQATATVVIEALAVTPGFAVNTATVRSNQVPAGTRAAVETAVLHPACGRVLTANTTLDGDVGPCAGDGLVVGADDIDVNLGGHRVFGLPGPGDGNGAGVRLQARRGVTVTNGTISGFDAGVVVYGGGANTLSKLEVRDNVGPDSEVFAPELGDGILLFNSAENKILDNTVVGNGTYDGIGVWGPDSHNNVIQHNVVEGTIGPGARGGPSGQGIAVNAFDLGLNLNTGRVVVGNRIEGNKMLHNASAGISNFNNTHGVIAGNTVEGNGTTNSVGNGIGVQIGPGAPPGSFMRIEANEVHANGVDGIRLTARATGNTVTGNDAADNNLRPKVNSYESHRRGYDLRDLNSNCAGNTWSNNTWGSGGYTPDCAAGNSVAPSTTPTSTSGEVEEALPTRRLGSG